MIKKHRGKLEFIEDAHGRVIAAPPNNVRVLCGHLDPLKPRQVEFKARIIAAIFAVNSTCQATSDTTYVAGNAKNNK